MGGEGEILDGDHAAVGAPKLFDMNHGRGVTGPSIEYATERVGEAGSLVRFGYYFFGRITAVSLRYRSCWTARRRCPDRGVLLLATGVASTKLQKFA